MKPLSRGQSFDYDRRHHKGRQENPGGGSGWNCGGGCQTKRQAKETGFLSTPSIGTIMSKPNQNLPKTADGTTDWEVVFEDAETGFVPLITQARTAEALRECTKLVIHKLFSRNSDGPMVEKFTADLDVIIGGVSEADELADTRDRVIVLLRDIKTDRLQRAEAYVALKKAKKDVERRHVRKGSTLRSITAARRIETFQRYFKGIVAACLVLMAALVGGVLYLTDVPTGDRPEGEVVAKKEVEPEKKGTKFTINVTPDNEEPEEEEPEAEPVPEEIERTEIVMRPINWTIDLPGGRRGMVSYLPRLGVDSEDDTSTVCRMWPRLFDTLNQVFNKRHPKGHMATEDELSKMAGDATRKINAMFRTPLVKTVRLIPSTDPEFRVTSTHPCRLDS